MALSIKGAWLGILGIGSLMALSNMMFNEADEPEAERPLGKEKTPFYDGPNEIHRCNTWEMMYTDYEPWDCPGVKSKRPKWWGDNPYSEQWAKYIKSALKKFKFEKFEQWNKLEKWKDKDRLKILWFA